MSLKALKLCNLLFLQSKLWQTATTNCFSITSWKNYTILPLQWRMFKNEKQIPDYSDCFIQQHDNIFLKNHKKLNIFAIKLIKLLLINKIELCDWLLLTCATSLSLDHFEEKNLLECWRHKVMENVECRFFPVI